MNTETEQSYNFHHVTEWIFDLDNTLYPRHADLMAQIDVKMTNFVARLTELDFDPARKLQKELYHEFGTTLNGLMHRYDVDPHEYLKDVHDIDYSKLAPNPFLGDLIMMLPGRKHIFTNGDVRHAENTLEALGIDGIFDEMFDIVAADFEPKPAREPYNKFLSTFDINPAEAVMFEDMPRNLEVPKALGMATVLITPQAGGAYVAENWESEVGDAAHIDFSGDDINKILAGIVTELTM